MGDQSGFDNGAFAPKRVSDETELLNYIRCRERIEKAVKVVVTERTDVDSHGWDIVIGGASFYCGDFEVSEHVKEMIVDHIAKEISKDVGAQPVPLEQTIPHLRKGPCPECGSIDLVDASQSMDCNACGHSW